METVELAAPETVEVPNLMGSESIVGANDEEARESDAVSVFVGPKIVEFSGLATDRGILNGVEPSTGTEKEGTQLCKINGPLNHGITNGGTALVPECEGKQIQRNVGRSPRNGSGSFKRQRISQADNLLHHNDVDDTKKESDVFGLHLAKCSNAEKSQAVKQKSNVNGRRSDRRNSRVQIKAKSDTFCVKAGLPNFSPANWGNNTFGIYGLKPEIHDITKLLEDISLDLLLNGSYKSPTLCKEKVKKPAKVDENILESVRKGCSVLQLHGLQKGKQTEEDQASCNKTEAPTNMSNCSFYQPRDILERLALPPPRDLDSLLQDAVKQAASVKLTDSRSGKPLSHRFNLPSFSWSHNYNGHCKSNNDATKTSNKSTCQGRWVRVRSTASFTGEGDTDSFLDLDSLAYDDNLVPAGQLKYRLPKIKKNSSIAVNQQDLSCAIGSTSLQPHYDHGRTSDSKMSDSPSPKLLDAALTLCDIAKHWRKVHSNGIMKWPKQPSQKGMKARKSRSSEKPEEGHLFIPKSEPPTLDHSPEPINFRTSSKKPKLSMVERRGSFPNTHTVIGLCSVSAPRQSRSRDPLAETRHYNGSLSKPPFVIPPTPPRPLDRSSHNPQKLKKVGTTMDWNRSRS